MTVSQRYVHTGQIALNVAEWDEPFYDAPKMVLVHGYGSNWHTWGRVTDKLSTHFHLFALDLRAMGRSGRYGKDSARQVWASDVADTLPLLTEKPVYLVGHSLGGWVTAAVAAQNPKLVYKATLVEPYSGAKSEVQKQSSKRTPEQRHQRAQQIRKARTPEDLVPAVIDQYEGASEESIKRIAMMWFQMDPVIEELSISRKKETETFDTMFSSIKCPTLIIVGNVEKGGILSLTEAKRVKNLIPNSYLLSWPKVGHSPHIARNHDFIRAVKKFWHE